MAKKSDFNTSRSVKDLQAEYGKMPPQAVDLEEAVLGALMLERDAFSIVGDLLEPDAFYKDAHQKIFRAIHKLFLNDDPVDLLTVSEALKQSGELEQVGGYYYLSQLTTRVASAAHIEFHAKIIVQKYLQRKLIGVCTELQEMATRRKARGQTSGGLAQLGERLHGMQEVTGSIPVISTRTKSTAQKCVVLFY